MFYMKKLSYKKIFLHDCWCTYHRLSIPTVSLVCLSVTHRLPTHHLLSIHHH